MIKRNPSQQRAIAHLSGPMMVLAGPGSGKTSVIVERTAYMINEGGISPSNILVVTFSRAAAKEMKERFLSFTGQQYTPVTFGTFHGVFYGILKQAYGFTAANILSDEEKFGILRELTLNYGGDLAEEGDFPEEIAREISVVKGNKIALEHYYSSCCPDEVFRQIYQGYREACQSRRKLDFDDMILYCYELFVQRKDILEAWQKKFQYILVDEFQDINQLQYDIVRMLAKPQNNLFIVG
ncbi:MAG: ATP-dependent helicase, partial [Blautia obeum]